MFYENLRLEFCFALYSDFQNRLMVCLNIYQGLGNKSITNIRFIDHENGKENQ